MGKTLLLLFVTLYNVHLKIARCCFINSPGWCVSLAGTTNKTKQKPPCSCLYRLHRHKFCFSIKLHQKKVFHFILRGVVGPIFGNLYSSIPPPQHLSFLRFSCRLFPSHSFLQAAKSHLALLLCGKAEMTYPTTPTMESWNKKLHFPNALWLEAKTGHRNLWDLCPTMCT